MGKGRDTPDPFAAYTEWIEHRYDPGYFLGGRIPPHLRAASLGPRGRRLSGLMLMIGGGLPALGIAVAGAARAESPGDLLGILAQAALPLLMFAAGVALRYRSPQTN